MFNIGDYVKITNSNLCGIITKIKTDKENTTYYININDKTVIVNKNMIENCKVTNKNSDKKNYNLYISSKPEDTIMIRHQTVNEAISNLEKFIDNAVCNNISQIKIIHGKNGGILRREVNKYLNTNPLVKEHRLGGYYEGSYGVTIAFLK